MKIVSNRSCEEGENQNRFIRSYYRPRRPPLRVKTYLVAVAEATWERPKTTRKDTRQREIKIIVKMTK